MALPKIPSIETYLLQSAGVTDEMMGQLIRASVKKTEEQLNARTRKIFCDKNGKIRHGPAQNDHATQGQAAERIMKYMLPRVKMETKAIELKMPDWGHGEVSEAQDIEEKTQALLEEPQTNAYTEDGKEDIVWEKEKAP